MDLQISVFLLFILFTAGHSLSCFECQSGACALKTCSSGITNCLSLTEPGTPATSLVTSKKCAAESDCSLTGSVNIDSFKYSSSCCNTDLCNVLGASDPSNAPNGNKCYYCDEQKNCSKALNCSGIQDRCGTSTRTVAGQTGVVKGCVSKSLCDATPATLGFGKVTCCEGNLCNGAQSVTQSFLFLCCSLLSYFMMH